MWQGVFPGTWSPGGFRWWTTSPGPQPARSTARRCRSSSQVEPRCRGERPSASVQSPSTQWASMIEISRDGGLYRVTVHEECRAPAEAVYDVLADLRTHMDWGGSWHPSKTQRLQSMDAPQGPATVGMEFWSVGTTSAGSWHDRSRVTEARRPSLFEFVTDGVLRDGQGRDRMSLHATHRYELDATEG